MNTYNISVRGVQVFEDLPQEKLQESLTQVRGIVWTSGGGNEDIVVSLNKDENHCNI